MGQTLRSKETLLCIFSLIVDKNVKRNWKLRAAMSSFYFSTAIHSALSQVDQCFFKAATLLENDIPDCSMKRNGIGTRLNKGRLTELT